MTLKPFVHERDYYIELTKSLSVDGYNIFSTIVERLVEFKNLSLIPESFVSKIEQYLAQERLEQQTFRSLMDEIQLKMTAGSGGEQKRQLGKYDRSVFHSRIRKSYIHYLDAASYVCIDDQIVEAKKFITKIVQNWNTILLELEQMIKKYEKQQREASKKVPIKPLPSGDANIDIISSIQNDSETSTILEAPSTSLDIDENNLDNNQKPISTDDETSRRSGVLKFFSNFLPNSDNDFSSLESPFNEDEHLQLPGKYIVNHRELSSIIAHALSMSEYEQRLNEEFLLTNENNHEQTHEIKQQDDDNDNSIDDHQHIELHFHDSSTKFTVKIFYAAKFHQLRQIIFSNNDQTSYIRSLSRCKKWQPRGGKSKSEFWQTFDDYFVLKDLNQKESLSFSTFAPSYIDHISNSLKYNRPTTLTKMFGIYHIQYRQNSTGENFKRDILVLENLLCTQNPLYNSTIPPIIYDLKGSMRNRLVIVDEAQTNVVLLDENFLTQTQENPIYVRLHTKWTLMKALFADTQFLAKHGIVDYSLLVSYHNDDPESIVYAGIIDYIRTYTWDKKIETIVKSINVGPTPTVISPEHYRTRFLRRMDQYFPVVPDEWHAYEKKFLDLSLFQTETMTTNVNSNELPTQ
jgi:1-phosphatidylinositol-3-phosphate 5-kinase